MILLPTEPRSFLGPDSVSVSEIGSLAACEAKWAYSYLGERPESAKSVAMARGTEVHRLVHHFRQTGYTLASDDEVAAWLIKRYAEHYASDRGKVRVTAIEQPFAMALPAPWDGHLFGFIDNELEVKGLVSPDGEPLDGLWLGEQKTMKDWQRLSQLPKDRQVTLYIAAARASGRPVRGVMFDAIRTQKWVRGPERPTAESFERIWIERTDDDIAEALDEMYSALSLRVNLTSRRPIRNVGQGCSWCHHLPACFGLDVTILDDDTAVELTQ